ncbi:zonular occludens toxin domain-containing protein [Methylomonas koyamae]|uniref:zonular occludens toxin domain-containing protein n=1 Tax=Methylomonas koyamae TaxID=702114 RepID=UPI0006D1D508|nr:zonular occludens toxin domain-containing protein [Methylomonas koyamae]BBL58146.1 hypothetical protein MKFW12EY_17590 [Methylomonas koyamae]
MAIPALVGLPGHGKSYSAVELFIIAAITEKRKIVTNIPLNIDNLKRDYPDYNFDGCLIDIDLDKLKTAGPEAWRDPATMPPSALYLLDELWKIWPAGLKASNIPPYQLSFIKEHRHYLDETGREPDIVLVTQNLEDICNAVRTMVETTIICTKLTAVGKKGNFRRDYYEGSVKGFQGPKSKFIRSDHMVKYQAEVWQYYKSHTKASGNVTAVNNTGVVSATVFNGLGFKIGVAALVLFISMAIWGYFKTSSDVEKLTKKPVTIAKPAPPATVNAAPRTAQPQNQPKPTQLVSSSYRLAGIYVLPGSSIAVIATNDGRSIRIDATKHCHLDIEYSCDFEQQKVTRYSGSSGSILSSPKDSAG